MNKPQTFQDQKSEATRNAWAKTAPGRDVRWTLHNVLRGVKSIYGCVHWPYCIENSDVKALFVDFHQ